MGSRPTGSLPAGRTAYPRDRSTQVANTDRSLCVITNLDRIREISADMARRRTESLSTRVRIFPPNPSRTIREYWGRARLTVVIGRPSLRGRQHARTSDGCGVALAASVGAVVGSPSPRRIRERAQNDGKRREALIAETSSGTRVFGRWPRSAKPPDLAWHATADHVRQRSNEDREGEWSDRVQVIAGSLQPAIGLLG